MATVFPSQGNVESADAMTAALLLYRKVAAAAGVDFRRAGREQELFPAPGLALASTANVYPEIVNCQSVLGVVDRVVPGLLDRLSVSQARVA